MVQKELIVAVKNLRKISHGKDSLPKLKCICIKKKGASTKLIACDALRRLEFDLLSSVDDDFECFVDVDKLLKVIGYKAFGGNVELIMCPEGLGVTDGENTLTIKTEDYEEYFYEECTPEIDGSMTILRDDLLKAIREAGKFVAVDDYRDNLKAVCINESGVYGSDGHSMYVYEKAMPEWVAGDTGSILFEPLPAIDYPQVMKLIKFKPAPVDYGYAKTSIPPRLMFLGEGFALTVRTQGVRYVDPKVVIPQTFTGHIKGHTGALLPFMDLLGISPKPKDTPNACIRIASDDSLESLALELLTPEASKEPQYTTNIKCSVSNPLDVYLGLGYISYLLNNGFTDVEYIDEKHPLKFSRSDKEYVIVMPIRLVTNVNK